MGLFGKNIVWRPHKMHCDFITFILTPNVTFQTISLCSDGRLVLKISAFELGILPRVPEIFSHTWWDITCIWVDQRPKTYANMGYCKDLTETKNCTWKFSNTQGIGTYISTSWPPRMQRFSGRWQEAVTYNSWPTGGLFR